MAAITDTVPSMGRRRGRIIFRSICPAPAPSTRAASSRLVSMLKICVSRSRQEEPPKRIKEKVTPQKA